MTVTTLALGSDDDMGSIPIVMGYMDDVNALVSVHDATFFVNQFEKLGLPIGAILNQEKTRVITSVNGAKLTERLLISDNDQLTSLGRELGSMIEHNSTIKGVPLEITDGIRILGSLVGNPTLCKDFISKAMAKAQAHADTILNKLDNKQSVLQLFKFCTAYKLTHLFSADVLTTTNHPRNWNTWDSDLCSDFNSMIYQLLSALTNNGTTPEHAILIASMSTKQGGLGIQHPRSIAIPAYFLTMKRNIQHATEGV